MKRVKVRKDKKLEFRQIRSKLKLKLRRGSPLTSFVKRKYHLNGIKQYIGKIQFPSKEEKIKIPITLCLIEDHESTIRFFNKLDLLLNGKEVKNLYIDYSKCDSIGLSASYIFDSKINDYVSNWKKKGYIIKLSGNFSNYKEVNNFLLSFGLLSTLNIEGNLSLDKVDYDYKNKYETYKFKGFSNKNHLKGNASTGLAGYFNKCFRYSKLELTDVAFGRLAGAFGEIIGNAEEHSRNSITEWNVLGCYDKKTKYCKFSILNKGTTIYENLSNQKLTSSEIIDFIEKTIELNQSHLDKKNRPILDPESVWNLMALQDGISSKRTETGQNSTRGIGLMDVLEFINFIKQNNELAELVLISGKSKILIDFQYKIEKKSGRRIIALNKENDLQKPPDLKKVVQMSDSFKGVIMTGRFIINEIYLKKQLKR